MASSIVLSGMEDDLSCFVILCEGNLLADQIWEEMQILGEEYSE